MRSCNRRSPSCATAPSSSTADPVRVPRTRRAPSPQRGEGWGEGANASRCASSPSPDLLRFANARLQVDLSPPGRGGASGIAALELLLHATWKAAVRDYGAHHGARAFARRVDRCSCAAAICSTRMTQFSRGGSAHRGHRSQSPQVNVGRRRTAIARASFVMAWPMELVIAIALLRYTGTMGGSGVRRIDRDQPALRRLLQGRGLSGVARPGVPSDRAGWRRSLSSDQGRQYGKRSKHRSDRVRTKLRRDEERPWTSRGSHAHPHGIYVAAHKGIASTYEAKIPHIIVIC